MLVEKTTVGYGLLLIDMETLAFITLFVAFPIVIITATFRAYSSACIQRPNILNKIYNFFIILNYLICLFLKKSTISITENKFILLLPLII